ncbi:MAG TPA: sugar ABC transporter ATP-binding protein [Bryobacteraceae bacterium]|nr:sugar ABC transporter ATP-binding protein [Bryobacteraceae bacterium]
MDSLVRTQAISKTYGGVRALDAVDFELAPGEIHALIGENGAGKSTLVKIITGAVRADSGSLEIAGQSITEHTPAHAKELGVAAIYQHPALFAELSVEENIALALERSTAFTRIDWTERRRIATELLARVGADISPQTEVGALTGPQRQLVEIARALGADARILILDEPTAALTHRETEKLFRVLRDLRTKGVGLIYISHRLEELREIADRVTVLRDGRLAGRHSMSEVDQPALIRLMAGRDLSQVFPKREVPIGDVVLETRTLTVRAGEIVGLAGLIGAGRTELAESIFGLAPGASIRIGGESVTLTSPRDAIARGIAYVPEDRQRNGVIPDMPVSQNISLADLASVSSNGFLDTTRERATAAALISKLEIKTPSPDAEVATLSGGNQQKVAIARWLHTKPRLLILDEPTQGIDVGAKAEVHRQMVELAADGVAILMISSELPEILGMSDRIAVMSKGRIAGILDRSAATQEKILALALGGSNS